MNPIRPALCLCFSLLASCGGGGAAEVPAGQVPVLPAAASFVSGIRLAYFPMRQGSTWVYEGEELGRPRHEEVRVLAEPRTLAGVTCTGLEQSVFVDGVLSELTTEWFAEDRSGNVWKLGEESLEFDGVGFTLTPDSWLVGQRDTWPFIAFPANLNRGTQWIGYVADGVDTFLAASRTAEASVPAGTFFGCLEIDENLANPEDADIILYASGVGRVSETSRNGFVRLVAYEVR